MGVFSGVRGGKMYDAKRWPVVASLDVHDAWTYAFVVDVRTGEVLLDKRIGGHYRNVRRHLEKLGRKEQVCVVFEAGHHGFAPWRCFSDGGFETFMVVPSSIPHTARRTKTDRDDAMHNLQCHTGGMLRYVQPVSAEDERARECLRERQRVVWSAIKLKQQLLSLIKRLGLEYTATKSNWTRKHMEWLRTVDVATPTRALIDMYLTRLDRLKEDEQALWRAVEQYLESNARHKGLCTWYIALPGVGMVTAATLVLEGGDLSRFSHPLSLMKYSGLIPGKYQSGHSDPVRHITKAGNKFLRTAIVSIAKYYQDRRTLYSAEQLKKMPTVIAAFIERCQNRLNRFYCSLRLRGKRSTLARVAVARELCGFLWELVTKVAPQLGGIPVVLNA